MQFLQTRGPPIIVLFGFCLYQRTHNDYVVMPNDWKPKGEVNSAAFLPVMALTAVVFTIIYQLRINALNLYLGSIVPSNTMDITSNVFIALARSVKNSEYNVSNGQYDGCPNASSMLDRNMRGVQRHLK